MPWHELPHGGWAWERPGADPPTELLPTVPPLPRRVPGATELPPKPEPERPTVDDPVLTQPAPFPLFSTPHDQPFPYDTSRVDAPAEEDPVAAASGPIETKVATATTAAAVATALSNLLLWVLETSVLHGPVPDVVSGAVQTLVIAAATFAAGWASKHTPRPDVQADPADIAAAEAGVHAYDGVPREGQDVELPARRLFDPDRDRT